MNWKYFGIMMVTAGQLYAWNSMGHRLIAQIAIDELPVGYVKKLSKLNHEMDSVYPPRKLVNSATWMDDIRFDDNNWYTTYHYVDKYFSTDGTSLPNQDNQNASWAIQMAIDTLAKRQTKPFNKAMSLRIILHVVGDIHQPLHAVSKVSKLNPQGDAGGNLYKLEDNPIGDSLHKYWDNGAGYLLRKQPVRYSEIVDVAHKIEKKYPCHSLPIGKVNVQSWLNDSYNKALNKVYGPLQGAHSISREYQQQSQSVSEYQVALAGCRLAKLLNNITIAYQ